MTRKTPKYLWNFVNLYETFPQKDKISKDSFRIILKMFNNLLLNSMIETGKVYKLGTAFGYLGVFTFPSYKQFDYQHFKLTGEKRNMANLHADELVAQVRFRQAINSPITGTVYRFRVARDPARKLAQLIKHQNYIKKYFSYEAYFD